MNTGLLRYLIRPSIGILLIVLLLGGCGTSFPRPGDAGAKGSLNGQEIFKRSLNAQTSRGKALRNVSYATDGSWEFLVAKVQPLTRMFHQLRESSRPGDAELACGDGVLVNVANPAICANIPKALRGAGSIRTGTVYSKQSL